MTLNDLEDYYFDFSIIDIFVMQGNNMTANALTDMINKLQDPVFAEYHRSQQNIIISTLVRYAVLKTDVVEEIDAMNQPITTESPLDFFGKEAIDDLPF